MRISDWSSDVCSSDLPSPPVKCTLALRAGFSAAFPASGVAMLGIIQIFLLVIVSQGSPCLETGSVAAPASTGHSPAISSFTFRRRRSEEHTSELQSLMRISYAVFCLNKQTTVRRPYAYHTLTNTNHNSIPTP